MHLNSGINNIKRMKIDISKIALYFLSFAFFSLSLSYIGLDVDAKILIAEYIRNIVPSLILCFLTIFLSNYFENRKKGDKM